MSARPELEPLPPPRGRTWRRRLVDTPWMLLRRRAGLLARGLERLATAPGISPREEATEPRFAISTHEAPFEELERVIFHPEVLAAVEATPRVALVKAEQPPLRLPTGADHIGCVRRVRPRPIYDVFPFGMELDLLEMRLHETSDLVDWFVIAEAPYAYGCMRKPRFLDRNWDRFRAFHHQIIRIDLPDVDRETLAPGGRRTGTDWVGDNYHRVQMWQRVRALDIDPDAVMLAGDADEMLPRHALYMLKHYDCPLPMRFIPPSLRYTFRWFDAETVGHVTAFTPAHLSQLDEYPNGFGNLPASRWRVRGAAHYTSFFSPVVMNAKLAMMTDWDPGVEVHLRNAHGETARMMREGRWFNGWACRHYDADADPLGLIPFHAKVNRARYPGFWGDA